MAEQEAEQEAGRPGEEYYKRIQEERYAMTDPGHETLKLGTSPDVIIKVMEDILADFENPDKKDRSINPWTLTRYYEQMAARKRALSFTRKDLIKFSIVEPATAGGKPIIGKNGESILRSKIPGYGIEVREISVPITREEVLEDVDVDRETGVSKEGEKKVRIRRRTEKVEVQVTEFGTDEERKKLVRIYDRAEQMGIVRQDLATLFWDTYYPNTASLENLVTYFHLGRNVPKFSNAELKTLFTLPDFNRVKENLEDRTLGDYIDLADSLFEIAAASEFKGRLKELMERPGWSEIVFQGMDTEEIKVWVGDVDRWVEGNERHKDSVKEDDVEKDVGGNVVKDEKGNPIKLRGLLTEFGNTWARKGKNEEAILLSRIEQFIAKDYKKRFGGNDENALRIAKTAVYLAYDFDKVSGWFAYLGKERFQKIMWEGQLIDAPVLPTDTEELKKLLKDKKRLEQFQKVLLIEGDPKTDDLTKLYHFRDYREKEFVRGRTAGPGTTIADCEERIALPFYLLAQTTTPFGRRSLREQKWGYAEKGTEGQPGYMPKESPKRLGDIDWDIWQRLDEETIASLSPIREELEERPEEERERLDLEAISPDQLNTEQGIWSIYTLFNWLAGRDDEIKGIYTFHYAEDFDPKLFGTDKFWKGKNKFLKIVINQLLKSSGYYRKLYEAALAENPNVTTKELTKTVDDKLTALVEESYDHDRVLFVQGLASLPPSQTWRAIDAETLKKIRGDKRRTSIWLLAKQAAEGAGYPFPDEYYEG